MVNSPWPVAAQCSLCPPPCWGISPGSSRWLLLVSLQCYFHQIIWDTLLELGEWGEPQYDNCPCVLSYVKSVVYSCVIAWKVSAQLTLLDFLPVSGQLLWFQIMGIFFCHSPVTLAHALQPCSYRSLNCHQDFLAGWWLMVRGTVMLFW